MNLLLAFGIGYRGSSHVDWSSEEGHTALLILAGLAILVLGTSIREWRARNRKK